MSVFICTVCNAFSLSESVCTNLKVFGDVNVFQAFMQMIFIFVIMLGFSACKNGDVNLKQVMFTLNYVLIVKLILVVYKGKLAEIVTFQILVDLTVYAVVCVCQKMSF